MKNTLKLRYLILLLALSLGAAEPPAITTPANTSIGAIKFDWGESTNGMLFLTNWNRMGITLISSPPCRTALFFDGESNLVREIQFPTNWTLLISNWTTLPVTATNNSEAQWKAASYRMSSWGVPMTPCVWCDGTNGLNVHHLYPQHLWPERSRDTNNMVVLCRRCHLVLGHRGNWKRSVTNLQAAIKEGVK